MTTVEMLLMKYGPTLGTKELSEVLRITPASIRNAISDETFPIPTYKEGKYRLADVRDVAAYMDERREGAREAA